MKFLILVMLAGFSLNSQAESRQITVPQEVNGHTIIYHAAEGRFVKQRSRYDIYSLKVALKLGTEVYQKGLLYFACNAASAGCQIDRYEAVASFKNCRVSETTLRCTKKISGDNSEPTEDTSPAFLDEEPVRYHPDLEDSVDHDGSRQGEYSDLF